MTAASPRRLAVSGLLALAAAASVLSGCSSAKAPSVNLSVFHLRPGTCVVTPTQIKAQLSTLKAVPCKEPHTEEVYALVVDHSGQTYPGTAALQTFANGACLQRYAGYVGVDYRDSSLFFTYLLPSVRSWAAGDHTVDCVISTTGQTLTRSVKGSKL